MTTAKINQELLDALKRLSGQCERLRESWQKATAAEMNALTVIANAERAQTQAYDLDSRVRAAEGSV